MYSVVSLPLRIFYDDPLPALRATIGADNGEVQAFNIPSFKIGTLDALVEQADELAKLSTACYAVVGKVADSLRAILDGDEEEVGQQKQVNDKSTDNYLRNFSWNKTRYRSDCSLSDMIENLKRDLTNADTHLKDKFNQYNSVKGSLLSLQRKQSGNLSTKSLTPIVDPSLLIQDSEYLETHLIVVPTNDQKDFLKSYEKLAEKVVPRSAVQVAQDNEFALFAVTTFKKTSADFLHKCREQKWTPRPYKFVEGGKEQEKKELKQVMQEERKVLGEALRLARTEWSESVMVWVHVLTLRVFVETVLRYGLPLEFVCALIKTTPKQTKKVKSCLDSAFSFLGGNALGRDKTGRITKDDAALTSEMAAAGLGGGDSEYTAYVYYEIDFP